jgi:predicted  nucleic acid-binding Zn-ribbon protein
MIVEEINMKEWERLDSIKTLKREITLLKNKKKRLYKQGWEINYNTPRGQKQGEKLQKELNIIENALANYYEEFRGYYDFI